MKDLIWKLHTTLTGEIRIFAYVARHHCILANQGDIKVPSGHI